VSDLERFSAADLLRALVDGGVDFVIIGGVAAQVHGSPILTRDLDVCYRLDRDNLERLAAVLHDLLAVRRQLPDGIDAPLDARALRAGDVFTLRTTHGDLDLLARPEPGLDYARLRSRAIRSEYEGREVWIAGLDDLIAMKRAAGRTKDLLTLEHLGALREEIDRGA
jgi:DNA-binding transcriptional LysR family regulator